MGEINRHLRIFISSTFLDMFNEREALQKEVFLKLKKIAKQRNVEITEVDLRWGITESEANNGETVKRCLDEIERCKKSPVFFLGIVGCRYGWKDWHQDIKKTMLASEDYHWMQSLIGCSITELEIYTALKDNTQNKAFLYFKQCNEYDNQIPDLQYKLKNDLRKNNNVMIDEYESIEEFKEKTYKAFKDTLDELFPEELEDDELTKIRNIHQVFVYTRQKVYIHEEVNYNRIEKFLTSDEDKLLVYGESGLGKSSLIANYFSKYKEDHSDELVIEHYIGAAGESSGELLDIFRHIMLEIKDCFAIDTEVPKDYEKIIETLHDWLEIPTSNIVIILDGFNQLSEKDRENFFVYMPEDLSENIKLLITSISDEYPIENTWEITTLDRGHRVVLMEEYLQKYGKKLPSQLVEKVIDHPQSYNPLFLKLFLDEIRVFGIYEKLEETIENYLQAESIIELFYKIFDRLENDYTSKHPGLLGHILSLIYVSRDGLSETNLLEIINQNPLDNFDSDTYISQLYLFPLILALEENFVNRDGMYGFFHNYIQEAVYQRYIKSDRKIYEYRKQLIHYFTFEESSIQKFREYPWHLYEIEEKEELSRIMFNSGLFSYLFKHSSMDLMKYYSYCEDESYFDEFVLFAKDSQDCKFINHVAKFTSIYYVMDIRSIDLYLTSYLASLKKNGKNNLITLHFCIDLADELLVHYSVNKISIDLYKLFINEVKDLSTINQNDIKKIDDKLHVLLYEWECLTLSKNYTFLCEYCSYTFSSENHEISSCPMCISENVFITNVEDKSIELPENLVRINFLLSGESEKNYLKNKIINHNKVYQENILELVIDYIKIYQDIQSIEKYISVWIFQEVENEKIVDVLYLFLINGGNYQLILNTLIEVISKYGILNKRINPEVLKVFFNILKINSEDMVGFAKLYLMSNLVKKKKIINFYFELLNTDKVQSFDFIKKYIQLNQDKNKIIIDKCFELLELEEKAYRFAKQNLLIPSNNIHITSKLFDILETHPGETRDFVKKYLISSDAKHEYIINRSFNVLKNNLDYAKEIAQELFTSEMIKHEEIVNRYFNLFSQSIYQRDIAKDYLLSNIAKDKNIIYKCFHILSEDIDDAKQFVTKILKVHQDNAYIVSLCESIIY